jgi:hypothetical protein
MQRAKETVLELFGLVATRASQFAKHPNASIVAVTQQKIAGFKREAASFVTVSMCCDTSCLTLGFPLVDGAKPRLATTVRGPGWSVSCSYSGGAKTREHS